MTAPPIFQRAFTLVELVIVLAVTGAMVAAVALFLRWPFQAYLDTARRAEISDIADTALRRIGRDLHIALPNSVRVANAGGATYLEMLPTITGGRYRAAVDNTGAGDILDFTAADTSFDMFGPFSAQPGQTPVAGNLVVVYNLGAASPGADAYSGSNTNVIASTGAGTLPNESKINFGPGAQRFPLASPGNTFQVISTPVTYTCTPGAVNAAGDGTGTLTRTFGYGITAGQPAPPVGGTIALLANFVTACAITYTQAGSATSRNAIVSLQISITRSNETVSLYDEVHVSNAP
jgi:MSHA biogenesis protein MshO